MVPIRHDVLDTLRRRLHERKYALLRARGHVVSDAADLQSEREPDWPDVAAIATSVAVLDTLGETERHEIEQVDEALARMAVGTYGECVECGSAIPVERLAARPEADRCWRCARN
jgi:RNA polymerase-binding protein DksA